MSRRARRAARLLLVAALATALSGCTGQDAVDTDAATSPTLETVDAGPTGLFAPEDRQPSPRIAGETLDGEELDVADLDAEVVVVNFWASWCAPCRSEAAGLVAVAERYADRGVAFVGVNVKDKPAAAQAFERVQGVPYPSIHDQPGVLLTRFRALAPQTPPTTLLLDGEGTIVGRFVGEVSEDRLDRAVQELLAEAA